MSFLETLAAKRQKFLDGLDANEGAINLGIFEDFYPDEAHFIYELLQNAEDVGAKEAFFELTPNSCIFEHNGSRHFDERDIDSITGIFNSSKKDNPDKIGKFGVGFKSVFVYTESPYVFSKNFSFSITRLVLPQPVPANPTLGDRTRFEFPFNSAKKNIEQAYTEIKAGLEQLSETSLLFLNNLQYIRWRVGEHEGAILRDEHSEVHIEVLKQVDGNELKSSHWLRFSAPVEDVQRFTAPVDGVERQRVAIAYSLGLIDDQKSYDTRKPLAAQLKIVPAAKGRVSVFFPAEKETSGLRYHLHAPFVPELSRASIKNTPENVPLFEQLGRLSARALHQIKDLGLLTGEFLAVLPNNDDELAERYKIIRKSIIDEMQSHPLVPTYSGGFASANRLVQARASMKALLSDKDLEFVTGRGYEPTWVIGATQKNSNQDRFLTSLRIPHWDAANLKELLVKRAHESDYGWGGKLDPAVMKWMASKSDEWHQALYAVLNKYCEEEDDIDGLDEARIVRLANGEYSVPTKAYFATGQAAQNDPLPRVSESILSLGTKKAQQEAARRFLATIGVMLPGEREEITQLLKARYGFDAPPPSDQTYIEDLRRFIAYSEQNPDGRALFAKSRLFRVESPAFEWCSAAFVYLDAPFFKTGLSAYYGSKTAGDQKRWPLSKWYLKCGIPLGQISQFAALAGGLTKFENLYVKSGCYRNPQWGYLGKVPGERHTSPIDSDYSLTEGADAALRSGSVEFSRLAWATMCSAPQFVLKAQYRRNVTGGSHYAPSNLVVSLKKIAWVPLKDGSFVTPMEASRGDLLEGFPVDSGYKWLEAVEFGAELRRKAADTMARAAKRAELGFVSEEDLQRALAFSKLPADEQERLLAVGRSHTNEEIELPERPVRNVDLRTQRVAEQAKQTPEKSSELRTRAVQLGYEEAKAGAKLYLIEQYTNRHGQMICQVCQDELPFRLPNGQYYFEAVEVIENSTKRFRETFLALCPNHAAAFRYANAQRNSMEELIAVANDREIEIVLGGTETTIYFTEMHLADIRACLASVVSEDADV